MSTATKQAVTETGFKGSDVYQIGRQINALLFGWLYAIEDLSAGADISTVRAIGRVPTGFTYELIAGALIHEGAAAGIDGSNTVVLTVRNITQSLDMATLTLTASPAANAASGLTVSGTLANTVAAAGDVIGILLVQGATANLAKCGLQLDWRSHDRITNRQGTVLT